MAERRSFLDDMDKKVLSVLQRDSTINLEDLEKKLNTSK